MDVDQYKEGIKKRREERLRLLRRKQRMESSSAGFSALNQRAEATTEQDKYTMFPAFEPEQREDLGMSPWIIKLFITVLLVVGVSVVMSSESPGLADAQEFIQDVMHRDFNVAGVMAWYEETSGSISFLPKIINRPEPREGYSVPVNGGKVVSEFGQDQQGILVGTSSSLPIEVVKGGWVKAVGVNKNLGMTIVIDHGDHEESWYGQVQDIKVEQNDWVEQGQVIGYTMSNDGGQGLFYFALKKNSIFVDPLDVITFD